MKIWMTSAAICLAMGLTLTGCETISEDACLAGSWEDIGFKDGEAGRSRSRLANITETCAEYGVVPDRRAYLQGLEMGLERYCGPTNGFNAGREGNTPNAECEAGGFDRYMSAYIDGNAVYEIERARNDLVSQWEDRQTAYLNVTARLDAEEMTAKERRRLERKAARLANEMDDLRIDIRAMERLHDLPRWTAPSS